MHRRLLPVLLLGTLSPDVKAQTIPDVRAEEKFLQQAGLATDGVSLRDWLTRYGAAAEDKEVKRLIQQLGSKVFLEREHATKQLAAIGPGALPSLRLALKAPPELEVRRRLEGIIRQLEKKAIPPSRVVRLLLHRQPAGTVEALLAFLPLADDETLVEEIWFGVEPLLGPGAKIPPGVRAALQDQAPARRALAAFLVALRGSPTERAAVYPLLADPNPEVRLRAAQGLLAAQDKKAVPSLFELLEAPAIDVAWQAEELLTWVAGEQGPDLLVGAGDEDARRNTRKAWEAWWLQHEAKVDLTKLRSQPRRPGLVLVTSAVNQDDPKNPANQRQEKRVWLFGCDGRPRWMLHDAPEVVDMQLVAGNRLLVAAAPNVVSEYDLKGTLLQQSPRDSGRLLLARRLSNGRTLLVTSGGLLTYSSQGELEWAQHQIAAAQYLPTGNLACLVGQNERLVEFDPQGRLLRSQGLPRMPHKLHVWPLADGHFLLEASNYVTRTTSIMAPGGQRVRGLDSYGMYDVVPLHRGHLLVTAGWWNDHRVAELDAAGRLVWEGCLPGPPGAKVRPCLNLVRLGFPERPASAHLDSAAARAGQLQSKSVWIRRRAVWALRELGARAHEAIPALINALRDDDKHNREMAAIVLREIGPDVIPHLVKLLQSAEPNLRAQAAGILYAQGALARVALPELIQAWNDPDPAVHANARSLLFILGPEAAPAVPALLQSLKSDNKETRHSSLDVLRRIASDSPLVRQELVRLLKDEAASIRLYAATALAETYADDPLFLEQVVFPVVAALFQDPEGSVRYNAVWIPMRLGPKAKGLISPLIDLAKRSAKGGYEESARINALCALASIGPDAKEASPIMIACLRDRSLSQSLRFHAAQHLGDVQPDPAAALPALREALAETEDRTVRSCAYRSLGQMGAPAVGLLREQLKKPPDRDSALKALAQVGPAARAAVPDLLDLLKDAKQTSGSVAEALIQIAPQDPSVQDALLGQFRIRSQVVWLAEPLAKLAQKEPKVAAVLLGALKDKDLPLEARAMVALGVAKAGVVARDAVPDLVSLLQEPYDRSRPIDLGSLTGRIKKGWLDATTIAHDPRLGAAVALSGFGAEAKTAIPALVKLAMDDKQLPQVAWVACWSLGKLAPHHHEARAPLLDILRNPDYAQEMRLEAMAALTSAGREAVSGLVQALDSRTWSARLLAIHALAAMGPMAKDAAPALRKMLRSDDPLLQRAADRALERIAPR